MNSVPRWLELEAEIGLVEWQISEMYEHVKSRTGLDLMIDEASGHKNKLRAATDDLIARHRVLVAEYEELMA